MGQRQVQVTGSCLHYSAYPAKFPRLDDLRRVLASEIELVFVGFGEIELLLRNGDVVLFPVSSEMALREFVRRNRLRAVHDLEPWNLLTEPFLDTEFSEEEQRSTMRALARMGFDAAEVEAIRGRVKRALLVYNSFAWEWVQMGLFEVLTSRLRCTEEFARWAFAISARGIRQAPAYDMAQGRDERQRRSWLEGRMSQLFFRKDFCAAPAITPGANARKPQEPAGAAGLPPGLPEDPISRTMAIRQAIFEEVVQRYSEPHRRYHGLAHLEQMISLLESSSQPSAAVLLAGWFHDAVYDPRASDNNEERSADVMETTLAAVPVLPQVIRRARELILYTKNHRPTEDIEEQALHDADLSVFGLDPESYARYTREIREEYAHVPDAEFRAGRMAFLEKMQRQAEERGRWFYHLDPIFEDNVETNLRWEKERLAAKGPIL